MLNDVTLMMKRT